MRHIGTVTILRGHLQPDTPSTSTWCRNESLPSVKHEGIRRPLSGETNKLIVSPEYPPPTDEPAVVAVGSGTSKHHIDPKERHGIASKRKSNENGTELLAQSRPDKPEGFVMSIWSSMPIAAVNRLMKRSAAAAAFSGGIPLHSTASDSAPSAVSRSDRTIPSGTTFWYR